MSNYVINHLRELESEAIFVIREIAAQFENPVLLFSGGKDSILLTHLAKKAFYPAKIPFPLIHVDTGHNFDETIKFRDKFCAEIGANLIVRSVEDSIKQGKVQEEKGWGASRNALQSVTLLDALEEFKFDAACGGARRDVKGLYKKARAGEIKNMTGISAPYQAPIHPDLEVITDGQSIEESVEIIINFINKKLKPST